MAEINTEERRMRIQDVKFEYVECGLYWTPEQYMWGGVLERLISDLLSPDAGTKEWLAKSNNQYSAEYALFVDDPTIGTAYWIAELIFDDNSWYDKLCALRHRVKNYEKPILPIVIRKEE